MLGIVVEVGMDIGRVEGVGGVRGVALGGICGCGGLGSSCFGTGAGSFCFGSGVDSVFRRAKGGVGGISGLGGGTATAGGNTTGKISRVARAGAVS